MSEYLLDANVVINWLKGKSRVVDHVADLIGRGETLTANAITVGEVYAGLADDERGPADRIFATLDYRPIDEQTAKLAGTYRYRFARRGRVLSLADTLLAAHAVVREATLVTGNVRDFPMPELKILRVE